MGNFLQFLDGGFESVPVVKIQVNEAGLIEKVIFLHFGTGVLGSAEKAGFGLSPHLGFLQDSGEAEINEEKAL